MSRIRASEAASTLAWACSSSRTQRSGWAGSVPAAMPGRVPLGEVVRIGAVLARDAEAGEQERAGEALEAVDGGAVAARAYPAA